VGVDDVTDVAISPDGTTLVMARKKDPTIMAWSLALGMPLQPIQGHVRWVISLAFSADSRLLAAGSIDGSVLVWDLRSISDPILEFQAHGNAVASLSFTEEARVLGTGSDDGTVSFWDLVTGDERATLGGHQGEVEALLFSRDSRILVTAGGRPREFGEAFIWRGTDKPDPAPSPGTPRPAPRL
jgi:WD40 repeat protein